MEYNFPPFTRSPIKVVHGIPIFAESDDVISFGSQWSEHVKTQLDSFTGSTITYDRALRMFGQDFYNLKGRSVLEAGSGAGRFTEILLDTGALVSSFDLSNAVFANKLNNGNNPNLRLFMGTIEALPFQKESFDFVFCPGVLQHTKKPKESLNSLYAQVKPGGFLIIDQYRVNLSTLLRTTWVFRFLLKRLDPTISKKAVYFIVDSLLPIHKFLSKWKLAEVLLFRISPITAHFRGYPFLSESDQKLWSHLSTFDNLTDKYKRLTTLKILRNRILKLGVAELKIRVMPYTLEIHCRKIRSGERPIAAKDVECELMKSSKNNSG